MTDKNGLPPWDDSMSDGCSVPTVAKPFLLQSLEAKTACIQHDRAYYLGGSRLDRLKADCEFALAILASPDREQAEMVFNAVRVFGGPHFRVANVSWAFGGDRFFYEAPPDWEPNFLKKERE